MKSIKIETSLGICNGYIATTESLKELSTNSEYAQYIDEDMETQWHADQYFEDIANDKRNLIIFDEAACNIFHTLQLHVAHFYLHNGWVKAELSDPSYGEPEWKVKPNLEDLLDGIRFEELGAGIRTILIGEPSHEHIHRIADPPMMIPEQGIVKIGWLDKRPIDWDLSHLNFDLEPLPQKTPKTTSKKKKGRRGDIR